MAADSEKGTILQFAPFHSQVDEGFWHKLSSLKLNKLGIDESPIPITGFYAPCSHDKVSNHLTLLAESFPSEVPVDTSVVALNNGNRNRCPVPGILYNTNTLEGFKNIDRQSLLQAEAKKICDDIHSGKVEENSSLLLRFMVISFAELKNWRFSYYFAFPTLVLNPPAMLVSLRPASQCLSSKQAESLSKACNEWRTSSSTTGLPFFLAFIASNSLVSLRQLADWEACQRDGDKVLFGFYDPCHLPNNPGWPLRNYLAYICTRWGLEKIDFLCYRERRGVMDLGLSLIGEVVVSVSQGWKSSESLPNVMGWEQFQGKIRQSVSLAKSMDPKSLAISAADLNLKLMKWRALPSLNLSSISSTRCLLLGAGTLGCQVARMLMAWGVRKITMVDSGRVAMSNPIRQSLYTFDDSMNGGKFKANAAVQSLERIFHAVEAEGIVMAIPMPGHPVTIQEEQNVLKDCKQLQELVEGHDAIFLLTDTRESRWLPTLLCSSANKITITAGLGFESFVVMRHGAGPMNVSEGSNAASVNNVSTELGNLSISNREGRQRLGCYFCNDVVAPIDSTANLTLDQQCTVTRPGLAPIASSLAVELLVGILQHPLGISADAEFSTNDAKPGSPLGIVPHQIRGSLSNFSQTNLVGHASSCCTACSRTVVEEYQKRGLDFILEAINNPMYLEDLTGLTELKNLSNSFDLDWDVDSDNDNDDFLEI